MIEKSIIDYLLADDNDSIDFIDELFFNHDLNIKAEAGIEKYYDLFLRLRTKEIRAHSWV